MLIVYNLLLTLLAPVWAPWMWWRARRRKESVNWRERMGENPLRWSKGTRRVWVHAVSVGEVVAALPLLKELRAKRPEWEIVLSVTTSSGHETARSRAEGLFDHLIYFPIDVLRFTMAALTRVRPEAILIMETELWPNFLWSARELRIPVFIVNGRISDRSLPRYRALGPFSRWLFGLPEGVFAQSEEDARRFTELGARRVEPVGNVKFDEALELASDRDGWRAKLGIGPSDRCVVVGSLRHEEFWLLGTVLCQLADSGVKVVVAPRHIEKTDDLDQALGGGLPRRSRDHLLGKQGLLLLDTYGELSEAYAAADVAIVGGSFLDLGGQNPLQPLAHGVPVVYGPYAKNFRDVTALAQRAGALIVATPETLRTRVEECVADSDRGEKARALVRENAGAAARIVARLP